MGEMPLANLFLKKEDFKKEKKFDLSIGFCPQCYLVQLIKIVPPEDLYRNYIYFSSTSQTFSDHCRKTAAYLKQRLKLQAKSLVIEIASNDGTQLHYFKELRVGILGIDPARNIAEFANKRGIPTLPEFFNCALAEKLIKEKNTRADLLFGANVLAHVPEITDFLKGVKIILKKKGTAVFEFPYLKGLLDNKFDTIYHEHVFYYSLLSLIQLFKRADLEIYDVEHTDMQGGSLRIFVSHPGAFHIKETVGNLHKSELVAGFDNIGMYKQMNKRVNTLRRNLIAFLQKKRKEGKSIAAYSAPAKGNILLNYFSIREYLDFIVDRAKEKQGLYTPGTHLYVYPVEKILEENPDYLLILCWNIAGEVIDQWRGKNNWKGKFIIPIPELKIV